MPDERREGWPPDAWTERLGLAPRDPGDDSAGVALPFREHNLNLGGRLHGGVLATALQAAGRWRARASLAAGAGAPPIPTDFQIFYLRPGGRDDVVARAHVLRQTRSTAFLTADVHDSHGHHLASSAQSFRTGEAADSAVEDYDPGPPAIPERAAQPPLAAYINQRYEREGQRCRLVHLEPGLGFLDQPLEPWLCDDQGAVASGYQLFLADRIASVTATAFAEERVLSATVTMQLCHCGSAPAEPLLAVARTLSRRAGLSHNEVTLHGRDSGRLVLAGQVTHLIRARRE